MLYMSHVWTWMYDVHAIHNYHENQENDLCTKTTTEYYLKGVLCALLPLACKHFDNPMWILQCQSKLYMLYYTHTNTDAHTNTEAHMLYYTHIQSQTHTCYISLTQSQTHTHTRSHTQTQRHKCYITLTQSQTHTHTRSHTQT